MPQVAYSLIYGQESIVNGADNTPVRHMIDTFFSRNQNTHGITDKNGVPFDTTKYNGFKFSEEMLYAYCENRNATTAYQNSLLPVDSEDLVSPMSYWGNMLAMIYLAINSNNGVSEIWDINLTIKANESILEEYVPDFLPQCTITIDDVETQVKWKDWGDIDNKKVGAEVAIPTIIGDRKLNMWEVYALYVYMKNNPVLEIQFMSNVEYRDSVFLS